MTTSVPQPSPHRSLLGLTWTGICLLGGLTLLAFAGMHYTACAKEERSINSLQSELEETSKVHQNSLSRLLAIQAQQTQNDILTIEDAKLRRHIYDMKGANWYVLSEWTQMTTDLATSENELQHAIHAIQSAKSALTQAGMHEDVIEALIQQLCEQQEQQ